jgi:hypothetical protein
MMTASPVDPIDLVFHRGPCHSCAECGISECVVIVVDPVEFHVCPECGPSANALLFGMVYERLPISVSSDTEEAHS